jgi:hypothetical protein
MIDNETIDRVCRGVGSVQEGELVRAEIERLTAACKGLSKLATAHGKEIERLRGLLARATEALGRFCSDEGWTNADADTLDDCAAAIEGTAVQPEPQSPEHP